MEGHWFAAVLACGEGAALSHQSAAALRGLISSAQTTIDVTIPRRAALSRQGLRVHRCTCLTPMDRTVVRGVPCTSLAWTLLDLATVVSHSELERACDQAEVLRLLDMAAVGELLSRRRGQPGTRRLRAVLGAGDVGEDIPRSHLERRFMGLCRRSGLPKPSVNAWITVNGEAMQVDFLWPARRAIVEVDGYRTHRTRQAFIRDRRRDRLLGCSGWQVARFTWDEVTGDADHVTRVLRNLLSRASGDSPNPP